MTCPGCSAEITLAPTEAFCPQCRHKIRDTQEEVQAKIAGVQARHAVSTARKWLMFVAISTLVMGGIQYFTGRSETEKQIAEAARSFNGVDPAERDRLLKERVGMTWQEVVDHDNGQVRLLLIVNIALAFCYLGLFFWAARSALVPAVIALLLMLSVIGVNAVMDPKTIPQGIIFKALMIAALSAAISSAYKARRATELVRPAT